MSLIPYQAHEGVGDKEENSMKEENMNRYQACYSVKDPTACLVVCYPQSRTSFLAMVATSEINVWQHHSGQILHFGTCTHSEECFSEFCEKVDEAIQGKKAHHARYQRLGL